MLNASVRCLLLTLAFIAGFALRVVADEQDAKFAALPHGVALLAPGVVEKSRAQGEFGRVEPVAVEGQSFAHAARLQTVKRPTESYGFQLRTPTIAAVKKGTRLLAVFMARAIEPQAKDGVGQAELVFEMVDAPYTKSVSHPVEFGPHWQRFYVPFEAKADHEAGKAALIFRAGYDPQTIEIGDVQALDFGPEFPREKLPFTPATYIGREPDAPWRRAAAERIERLRKANLTVTVTDGNGRPMPGVNVHE